MPQWASPFLSAGSPGLPREHLCCGTTGISHTLCSQAHCPPFACEAWVNVCLIIAILTAGIFLQPGGTVAECSPCRSLAFISTPEQRLCRSCYGNRSIRLLSPSLPNIQPPWRRVQPLRLSCDSGTALKLGRVTYKSGSVGFPEENPLFGSGCEMLVLLARLSWKTPCEPAQPKSVPRL